MKPTLSDYLKSEVEKFKAEPHQECIKWQYSHDRKGYGWVYFKGKTKRVPRIAYEIFYGKEPMNLVLHTCDNPSCFNPLHLYDGTYSQNLIDARIRGRLKGRQNGFSKHEADMFRARVTRRPLPKFSVEQVRRLLELRKHGLSNVTIGRCLGIGETTVRRYAYGNGSYESLRQKATSSQ